MFYCCKRAPSQLLCQSHIVRMNDISSAPMLLSELQCCSRPLWANWMAGVEVVITSGKSGGSFCFIWFVKIGQSAPTGRLWLVRAEAPDWLGGVRQEVKAAVIKWDDCPVSPHQDNKTRRPLDVAGRLTLYHLHCTGLEELDQNQNLTHLKSLNTNNSASARDTHATNYFN